MMDTSVGLRLVFISHEGVISNTAPND